MQHYGCVIDNIFNANFCIWLSSLRTGLHSCHQIKILSVPGQNGNRKVFGTENNFEFDQSKLPKMFHRHLF